MFNQIKYYENISSIIKSFIISILTSIFLSILILLLNCSSFANENALAEVKTKATNSPKLVLQKSLYDFGEIKPNSMNKAVFNFANAGDEPLIIKDVKKCCGAVIELDKEQLAPGENAVLSIEYHNGTGTGTFKKTVSLTTNEPNNPQTILTITGTMIQTLKWEPERYEIASFREDVESPAITIKSLDNTPFSVKKIRSSLSCISADFDPNYSATEIVLKPLKNTEKIKYLSVNKGSIVIELDHADYKTISLNFDVIQSLQAIPAQILVFNAKANATLHKSVELQDYKNMNVTDISGHIDSVVAENGMKVELIKSSMVEKKCKLDLEITPSKNDSEESFSKDQIVIKMKDGRELIVPIRIFYASETLTSKAD